MRRRYVSDSSTLHPPWCDVLLLIEMRANGGLQVALIYLNRWEKESLDLNSQKFFSSLCS